MIEAPPSFHPPYWDASAPTPRFKMGKKVRVKHGAPPGHIRTPWYIRGRVGVVERICGHFPDPQELAYRRDGLPKKPLYRVRFALAEIWGEEPGFRRDDTIDVEIYEHWLEPYFDYDRDPQAEAAKIENELSKGAPHAS